MAYIKCDGCGEIIEIPAELCPDPETIAITEPYYCDACEPRSGLTQRAADGVVRAAEYGATSNCVDCGRRIVFCGDGVWLHCEPQNHGHARPNGAIVNPPRN